jgi:hypothetical protein|tara:strand:- start:71 stop:535 length:465 start_codon:yes stop_codon:yes gene_type:complete
MKHVQLFKQFINESEVHTFGADSDTEKRAGGIGSTSSYLPWKNSKALIAQLKSYYVKPALIKTLSTSRVTIKPGSPTYITFNAKDGFDMDTVIQTLTAGLKRFCKVNSLHILFTDIQPTVFSLMIQNNYDVFTDDRGKEINMSRIPDGYYIDNK